MAQPNPMSTPIFDELLRELAGRTEDPPTGGQQADQPDPGPAPASSRRHRAD